MIVYRLIDGLWQALARPPVTPPPPPAVPIGYGTAAYGSSPYGQ